VRYFQTATVFLRLGLDRVMAPSCGGLAKGQGSARQRVELDRVQSSSVFPSLRPVNKVYLGKKCKIKRRPLYFTNYVLKSDVS